MANTRARVSVQDPGRAAETTPSGMEIRTANVEGGAGQRQRVGQPGQELVEHQLVGPERPAEVQAQHAPDPARELHHLRVVEAEPLPYLLQLLRSRGHVPGVRPPVDPGGIARRELEDDERDEEHHEEDGDEEQEPVGGLAEHPRSADSARPAGSAPGGVPWNRDRRYFRSTVFQTCGQKNSGCGW